MFSKADFEETKQGLNKLIKGLLLKTLQLLLRMRKLYLYLYIIQANKLSRVRFLFTALHITVYQ